MNIRVLGTTLLIAGTTIGAGMLALPVSVGLSGFIPSSWMMFVGFLFMLYCLLLILEINLWFPKGSDIISMIHTLLGSTARNVTWVTYLILMYSLLCAYIMGITPLVQMVIEEQFNISLPAPPIAILFVTTLGYIVYHGTRIVDYVNRPLAIGFSLIFVLLIFSTLPKIEIELLKQSTPELAWVSIPLVMVAFLVHAIVPTIREYLNNNTRHVIIASTLGLLIPLLLFSTWQLAILGIIPTKGVNGLFAIANSDASTSGLIGAMSYHSHIPLLGTLVTIFSALAIITSFLGIALSLSHFLKDGLKTSDRHRPRLIIAFLTFVPPLLISLYFPGHFVLALKYAGILTAVLFCVFPALMAWKGRYIEKRPNNFRMPGGKAALLLIIIVSIFVSYIEIAGHLNWLPNAIDHAIHSTLVNIDDMDSILYE